MSYPALSTAKSPNGTVFDLSLTEFLDLYDTVSVRLYNGIRYGASEGRLPYPSIGAYLRAGPERIEQLLRLPALGRKSVLEFDELATRAAAEFSLDVAHATPDDRARSADPLGIPTMFDIPLDSFLAQQATVSPRLMRAVRAGIDTGDCPFSTVAAYLRAGDLRLSQLCKLPNLGVTSAREFDELVQDAVRNGSLVPPLRQTLNATGFPDLDALMHGLLDTLDERQTKLLLDRIDADIKLDLIARDFGLTRGRVHQIEKDMTARLIAQFGQAFLRALAAIEAQCREREVRELSLDAFASLVGADALSCARYLQCLQKFRLDETRTLVLHDRVHVYRPAAFPSSDTWDERVDQALIEADWPLVYRDFLTSVPDVPRFYVAQRLCQRYHAHIAEDTFSEPPRLNVQKMCLQVLTSARAPMHLTEIRAGVFAHFGVDLSLQHVAGTVSGQRLITICAPGTYARYVDLPYSSTCIQNVCDRMQRELAGRQVFLSSKVLFERLFAADLAQFPERFNHYLLLGFAQGDARFAVKRGNMIGLAGFDIAKTYISLEDEVRNLVFEHGPISVSEIVARLAPTRKLCNDTGVRLILANSPDVIEVGRRTYDSLHRFFANREEYDTLVLALHIALLAGTKSVYALADEMALLGLDKASTEVIGSILAADSELTQTKGMYGLTAPDPQLQRYQDLALASLAQGGVDRLRRDASAAFGGEMAARLIGVDRRFQVSPSARPERSANSALHAILADFEF